MNGETNSIHPASPIGVVQGKGEKPTNLDKKQITSNEPTKKWKKFFEIRYYTNNLSFFIFIILYILLQLLALAIQINYYKSLGRNDALLAARAFGVLINFNLALTVLLVLRYILTRLRNRKFIRSLLPFDNFIDLHKFIGVYLIVLSIGHTVAHGVNLYWLSKEYAMKYNPSYNPMNTTLHSYVDLLFTKASGIGWVAKLAIPTGWAILALMIAIAIFSTPIFRRKGHFEIFHYAHWLFVPIFVLTIIHCVNFWKWFVGPGSLLVIEFIFRHIYTVLYAAYSQTYIKSVNLLASGVTHLVISRQKNFRFKAGDYIFVRIPEISIHEWHPFTISSAPELSDEIWLHIRSLGNWTKKLHNHFLHYNSVNKSERELIVESLKDCFSCFLCKRGKADITHAVESGTRRNKLQRTHTIRLSNLSLKINVDGPYGTSSRRAFKSQHAVLIAAGIGVTPFASILQSLLYKYSRFQRQCPNCSHIWCDKFEDKRLRKVDFIWVNREFKSFEWFIELLAELEVQQSKSNEEPFINIRLYNTSKDEIIDASAINAFPNREFSCEESRSEHESKLNSLVDSIQSGRPNLNKIFTEIDKVKKGDVHVLFCGAPAFGDLAKAAAFQHNFQFSREYF